MLLIVRGLPGSGKSTFAKGMIERNAYDVMFEADDFFTDESGNYQYDASKIKDAHKQCFANVEKALKEGKRVIVSNTFTRLWEMEPYVNLAKQIDVPVSITTCTGVFRNVHDVSDDTMQRMKDRFEYDIDSLLRKS